MNQLNKDLYINQVNVSRRNFMKSSASIGLILGASGMGILSLAEEPAPFKVVVVGGGYGGATAAKYLKMWGKTAVDVTMIEPNELFMSPIMSGMVVTSQLEIDRISFNYDRLSDVHGVNVVQDSVTSVDSVLKTVTLSDGTTTVSYDRLILSPGIDFVDVPGWDPEELPHAWGGSEQTLLLQEQLANFPVGGTLVITVPTYPFRCPPGPYERASAVADYLRVNNKNAKVIVLDTQGEIFVENELFHSLYDELGVEYHNNSRVVSVTSGDDVGNSRSVTYETFEREPSDPFTPFAPIDETTVSDPITIEADVINLIPDNKATPLIFDTGLVGDSGLWAPVNELTYESTKIVGIHILGDSVETMQSKAGQMANAQAKVCADAIIRTMVHGLEPYGKPITTAGGYAPLTQSKVNWIAVSYGYDEVAGVMMRTQFKTAPEPTEENWDPMLKWANNLFADTFG